MGLLELGLFGLFCGAFLSATLLPFPSDFLLIGAYELGYPIIPALVVATIGNLLGSFVNYWIGYKGNSKRLTTYFNLDEFKLKRWEERLNKRGVWLGLLAWLPFVGDPMVIAFGFFKVRFWPLAFMMLVGKLGRYLVISMFYL